MSSLSLRRKFHSLPVKCDISEAQEGEQEEDDSRAFAWPENYGDKSSAWEWKKRMFSDN